MEDEEQGERPKRHCWECRRRCLVCDFAQPGCRRCAASGTECPGYKDVKPTRIKWLAPGRVKSRGNKRNPRATRPDHDAGSAMEVARHAKHAHVMTISRFEIRTELCVLPQVAEYFNSCIYHDLAPILELGRNPHVYRLTARHLRVGAAAPDYLQFGMACVALSHRLNRTRRCGGGSSSSSSSSETPTSSDKTLAERFYLYWGLAVRSLSEKFVVAADGSVSDVVIAGILTLLLTDVQNGTSLNWRCHVEGVYKIISLRGGLHAVAKSRSLEPLLLVFWYLAVIGNTTCPATDLTNTSSQLESLDLLTALYAKAASPLLMCPLPLFAEITRINHLRSSATTTAAANDLQPQEALDILARIEGFSPTHWAASKPRPTPSSQHDWILIGEAYRSAAAKYCILSLQGQSLLPATPELRTACALHGRRSRALLAEGLSSPRTKRFMLWPLVVLGVEAGREVGGDAVEVRDFVSRRLPELSRELGTYAPLTAKRVLERFWARREGDRRWDVCFDRPYAFTTQIAVDTSRFSLYD